MKVPAATHANIKEWAQMEHRAIKSFATSIFALVATAAASDVAFVVTSDFSSGGFSSLTADRTLTSIDLPVYQDLGITEAQGMVYMLEKFGPDNIIVVDPANPAQAVRQFSTGNGSNPQQMAVVSPTKAYITRLERAEILIVNPATGDSTGTVDLLSFADGDGIPEMAPMVYNEGGMVYVGIQRLDRLNFWVPTGPGKVIVIDPSYDSVVTSYDLTIENPVDISIMGERLFVAGGGFGNPDGVGIDTINVSSGSVGRLVGGASFTGQVTQFLPVSETLGYAIASGAWPLSTVHKVDPSTGALGDTLLGAVSPSMAALSSDGTLLVGDRNMTTPGVLYYDAATGVLEGELVTTGLPPSGFVLLDATVGISSGPTPTNLLAVGNPAPNPFNPSVTITVDTSPGEPVHLSISNILGQTVHSTSWTSTGFQTITWNGTDASGRKLASGTFYVHISSAGEVQTRTAILQR